MNFSSLTLNRLAIDADRIKINTQDLYIKSYPHLVKFFADKKELTESDLVQGIHMVYAWMPTTLKKIDMEQMPFLLAPLNDLKKGSRLHKTHLEILKTSINNSMVGVSKLLHFISPDQYAIWDSRVVKYITQNSTSYGVDSVENYSFYMDNIYSIVQDPRFREFHKKINSKMGYEVSNLRAVEVVMFLTR